MLQEHSLFCLCFKTVNIGYFAVESSSQTSSSSHESEPEGSTLSPSHQQSDSGRTTVRVRAMSHMSPHTFFPFDQS